MTIFGTDGIRGKFGDGHITPDFFLQLGLALGSWLGAGQKVLIGKDTRLSGYILESSLEAGLASMGVDVYLTGPISTPGISYLTKSLRAKAGIIISASHNPYTDNGIKIFNSQGMKICSSEQQDISSLLQKPSSPLMENLGKVYRVGDTLGRYVEYVKNQFDFFDLRGARIALDCAHGALYQAAPMLYRELNAKVTTIGDSPDGYNINKDVGVLHPDKILELANKSDIDLAFSFDGDGDRLLVVERGRVIPSEHVLLFLYDLMKKTEGYAGGIVGTVLANSGLKVALDSLGVPYSQTSVGDRFLASELSQRSWSIAGEPSGHYILFNKGSTADGLLCSLAITTGIYKYGMSFDKYQKSAPLKEQVMESISYQSPNLVVKDPSFQELVSSLRQEYPQVDIHIRASGTEPKVRVSLQADESTFFQSIIKSIRTFIDKHF